MELPEINSGKYRVWFDPELKTVYMEGTLRLSSDQYTPIAEFLRKAIEVCEGQRLILNLCQLEFLNSSGINTLYKFAIALRKQANTALEVRGSRAIGWQTKSLSNLKRFYPGAELVIS